MGFCQYKSRMHALVSVNGHVAHHSTRENEVSSCGFILTCQSNRFPSLTTTTSEMF